MKTIRYYYRTGDRQKDIAHLSILNMLNYVVGIKTLWKMMEKENADFYYIEGVRTVYKVRRLRENSICLEEIQKNDNYCVNNAFYQAFMQADRKGIDKKKS